MGVMGAKGRGESAYIVCSILGAGPVKLWGESKSVFINREASS